MFDLAICGIGQLPSKVEVELIVGVDGKIIDSDAIFADWSGWGGMSIFSALLFVGQFSAQTGVININIIVSNWCHLKIRRIGAVFKMKNLSMYS